MISSSSIVKFKCALCPVVAEFEDTIKYQVVEIHKDWKAVSKKPKEVKQSPHTNQTWLQDIVR